jgi:hypothetical protein
MKTMNRYFVKLSAALGALLLLCSATSEPSGWQKFQSAAGKCEIAFPATPEHVRQKMSMPDEEYDMAYDVYISTQGREAVYMVLIAQYPPFVDDQYAEVSLESFLNGILNQHPNNELVFADLIQVQGHKGMDFFIKTQGVFFKGRAVMAGSNLYLLAMECEHSNYNDVDFKYFIQSFALQN